MPQTIREHPTNPNLFQIEVAVNVWQDIEKVKPSLEEIKGIHEMDAIVMGSGPSLPSDLVSIPDLVKLSCITFSANHHPLKDYFADYMCFLDSPDSAHDPRFKHEIINKKNHALNVSYNEVKYTDYYCINEGKFYDCSDSGIWAAWVASYVCTGTLHLCGFGLRSDHEPMHYYNSGVSGGWGGRTMEVRLDRWKRLFDEIGRDRINVVSGPLKNI